MLQWKARLLGSLVTLALIAAALVGGFERFGGFGRYLDW